MLVDRVARASSLARIVPGVVLVCMLALPSTLGSQEPEPPGSQPEGPGVPADSTAVVPAGEDTVALPAGPAPLPDGEAASGEGDAPAGAPAALDDWTPPEEIGAAAATGVPEEAEGPLGPPIDGAEEAPGRFDTVPAPEGYIGPPDPATLFGETDSFPPGWIGPVPMPQDLGRRVKVDRRNPYRIELMMPQTPPVYMRPWDAYDPGVTRGMRHATPSLRHGAADGLPFRSTVLVDRDRDMVRIVTDAGDNLSYVSYAGPIDEYRALAGYDALQDGWTASTQRDLGLFTGTDTGGLLDIDIPMPLGADANLKVRGSERITFGGSTTYLVDALDSEAGAPSRFPQLDMQQQLTVNLEGTIGNKIHVFVDHRSGGNTFGMGKANEIRVHYQGDEDEIIQRIELGEVNLSLPGTEFVSYSGHHEGLFGAKMLARIGRLGITAIASKEEGKSSGANFSGTSEADSIVIKDLTYKKRTFFAVDSPSLKFTDTAVGEIRLFVDDRNGANDIETGALPAVAYYVEENGSIDTVADTIKQFGMFDELIALEDYLFNNASGMIEFLFPISDNDVLAVEYTRLDGYSVGGVASDTLRLKMIKREGRVNGSPWEPTRIYEMKHVYDLGADDIPEESFFLNIRKQTASGEDPDSENGVPYVQILGLDTSGLGGDPEPDGLVDPQWIDYEKGYLFYPDFTPYCPDYDDGGFYPVPGDTSLIADELEEPNCNIYEKESFDPSDDIYYAVVKYSRLQTTFYLGQINIIENSEIVRLNGVRLTRGVDYTIYYPTGQLTLLNEEAKEPEAKVTVDYDYRPFGLAGEKTLLGARGVYRWSENVELGTTWMYQSKGTPDDHPRLGEEPTRTVIGDANISALFEPYSLTRIADAIPLIDTDVPSRLAVNAEMAVSMPEPNTKGFVAIDDMEGVDNINMLGVSRRLWTPASVPEASGALASDRMDFDWYNPDQKVRAGDLYPYLPTREGNELHTVLEIDYDAVGSSSWGGLMRLLSKTGNDYSKEQFFQLWVNDDGTRQGRIHIDLGTISEDFYPLDPALGPNAALDSEDVDRNGFDAGEDTGLDNVWGLDGDNIPGDDGNDDYAFTFGTPDYTRINGPEGNERLDTEDLNGNWYLDEDNRYWEFTVDLSPAGDEYLSVNNYPINGENWRLYRIPLGDALPINAITDWTVIKSARVWFEDLSVGAAPLMIGAMDIVGNRWVTEAIRDASGGIVPEEQLGVMAFIIVLRNTKEDAVYAADPPYDPGFDEDTQTPKREQSLALHYENLDGEHSGSAVKRFFTEEDYTTYGTLEFYVHGDREDLEPNTVFFLRIGADSLNYYEYSLEMSEGWNQIQGSSERRLAIAFESWTDLKLGDYALQDTVVVYGDTTRIKGETFRRIGWPSLARVRALDVGVRNENEEAIGNEITGEVWVDDLILTNVRKDIGWAQRVTVGAKFADLMALDVDVRHVDGNYHSLKQKQGSGQDNLSYNVNSTLNADRFVSGLGISIPVNVNYKKSVTRPQFSTGSDIVLDPEESNEEKTVTRDRSFAASLSRKRQSPDFWPHLLLDGLSLRGSISDHMRLSPTRADSGTTIRGRAAYKYSPEKKGWNIFGDTQFFIKPTSIRFLAESHLIRNRSYDISPDDVQTRRANTHDNKLNLDGNIDFQFLDNLRTTHSAHSRRDLTRRNEVASVNAGSETERRYANSLNFNPKFGRWLAPQYSFGSNYNEQKGPDVRRQDDPPDVRNIRASTTQELRASFDFKKLLAQPSVPRQPSSITRPQEQERRPPPEREERSGGFEDMLRGQDPPDGDSGAASQPMESREERDRPPTSGQQESRQQVVTGEGDDGEPPGEGEEPTAAEEPQAEGPPAPGESAGGSEPATGELPPAPAQDGRGLRALWDPIVGLLRQMDAIEGRYALRWDSRYDRIAGELAPGWDYMLGLSKGLDSDDRSEETTFDIGTGIKFTNQIRLKGSYKRTRDGRWYRNTISDTVQITSQTESMNELTKGTLSWNAMEKIGPLSGLFASVRARSGIELRRSSSGPAGVPTTRGEGLAFNPIISVDTKFKNGLTANFSWDKKRSTTNSLTGAGSVTQDEISSTSITLNYRFSAPQGLKLPFFGQSLKFTSNLDTSLTIRTSAKEVRTAPDLASIEQVNPTSSSTDLSVTADATYSFSRSVSGGLQINFSQARDVKREQTRRTIGMHLTAEFKF